MGSRSKRDRLKAAATAHVRTPQPFRLVEPEPERRRLTCDYVPCSRPFTPARDHQRFDRDVCRVYANQHPERDRKANGRRAREAS